MSGDSYTSDSTRFTSVRDLLARCCPKCGLLLELGESACPDCDPLPPSTAMPEEPVALCVQCPGCQAMVPAADEPCSRCGFPLRATCPVCQRSRIIHERTTERLFCSDCHVLLSVCRSCSSALVAAVGECPGCGAPVDGQESIRLPDSRPYLLARSAKMDLPEPARVLGLWRKPIFDAARPALFSSPVVQSGSVFVLTDSGRLMVFDLIGRGLSDAANGLGEAWAQQPPPEREVGLDHERFNVPHVSLVSHQDQLYVASEHGSIWQIDSRDLSKHKHISSNIPPVSTPLVWARGVCFCGSKDGDLVAVRLVQGHKPQAIILRVGDVPEGSIGIADKSEKYLFWPCRKRLVRIDLDAFTPNAGNLASNACVETVFEAQPNAEVLIPTVGDDHVYVADTRGNIRGFGSGDETLKRELEGSIRSAPCWARGYLVVHEITDDGDMEVRFLDKSLSTARVLPHTGTGRQEPLTELLFIEDSAEPRHDMMVYGVWDQEVKAECLCAVLVGGRISEIVSPRPSQSVEGELTLWLSYSAPTRMLFATSTKGSIYAFQICEE